MIAVGGRIQREGAVVHLVAHRITDLSRDLASLGEQEDLSPPHDCDEPRHGAAKPDMRDGGIRVRTRDFR